MLIPPVGRFKFFDQPNKMKTEYYSYRWKEAKKLPDYEFLFTAKDKFPNDKADDGTHMGVEWQQSLAEQFIDDIEKCI